MDSKIEKLQSCLALFRDMPEASILINYRSRNNMLTFDERLSVTQAIDKAFAPVFLEMRAESPSLSESDLIHCALVAAGFKSEVIADCISISKDSLRTKKRRLKEKLSQVWSELLFPESESVTKTVTKSVAEKCYDNDTQHISRADEAPILLQQNQLNSKVMETKKVTFSSAVKSGWKNCFKYSGRASRKEFWIFFTFNVFLFLLLGLITPRISFHFDFKPLYMRRIVSMTLYMLAIGVILPLASLIIRRLHDSEKNGWLSLIVLIPVFVLAISPLVYIVTELPMAGTNSIMGTLLIPGLAAIIALCSLKGTEGPNNYGPDPNVITQPASETI